MMNTSMPSAARAWNSGETVAAIEPDELGEPIALVARPEVEAAGHDRGLLFAFGLQDAVEADDQALLGDLGEVHVDRRALRDRRAGGDVLRDLHGEAVGDRHRRVLFTYEFAPTVSPMSLSDRRRAIGGVRQVGEVQVADVVRQIAGQPPPAAAGRVDGAMTPIV